MRAPYGTDIVLTPWVFKSSEMEVAHSAKEVCEQQQLHMFTHAAPARSTLFTQVASYLPRIAKRPALRCGEGGVIRSGVEGGRE